MSPYIITLGKCVTQMAFVAAVVVTQQKNVLQKNEAHPVMHGKKCQAVSREI